MAVHKANIIPKLIKLIKDGSTDDCRGHAAACLWNLACDDDIRPQCMDAIDPLVQMAHECHSVDARRRAAVALDCLMAYESFERDWCRFRVDGAFMRPRRLELDRVAPIASPRCHIAATPSS